jgi:O-antigen/teichoic acid export membrane protein
MAIFSKLIFEGLQPVLLPALSEKVRRGEDLREVYLRAMEYVPVLYWPFLAMLGLMADPIVRLLLGDQWLEAGPLVQIFCGVYAVSFPAFITQPLLMAVGRIRDTLKINLILVPISLTMMVIGSLHSLIMVAWLSYIAGVAGFIVTLVMVRRHVPFELSALLRRTCKSAVVTLIASSAPIAVQIWTGWHVEVPIPAFLLAAAGFSALWLLAVFAVRHPFRLEIRHIVQAGRGKVFGT